jgi:hypothetical protein
MSLLSININQYSKLSLKEVTLPAPKERELKPLEAIQIEKPLPAKEIFYNRLITTYPLFKELVDTFDLIIE